MINELTIKLNSVHTRKIRILFFTGILLSATVANGQALKNYRINVFAQDTMVFELSDVTNFGVLVIGDKWFFDEWGLWRRTNRVPTSQLPTADSSIQVKPFALSYDSVLVIDVKMEDYNGSIVAAFTQGSELKIGPLAEGRGLRAGRTDSVPANIELYHTWLSMVQMRVSGWTIINVDGGDIGTLTYYDGDKVEIVCSSCHSVFLTWATIQNLFLSDSIESLVISDVSFMKNSDVYVSREKGRVKLELGKVDFGEADIDYQFLKYTPFAIQLIDTSTAIRNYKLIRDHQAKFNHTEGLELVSKELKEFEYIINSGALGPFRNWLDKNWWDYGYQKGLIMRNSLLLMVTFFIFNCVFYGRLVTDTYPIESLTKAYRVVVTHYTRLHPWRIASSIGQSFLYTAAIFWGVKLDIGRLSLRYPALTVLIVLQYTTGIVCLAYLANYIIVR